MNIPSPRLVQLQPPLGWPPRHLGGMTDGLATRWCPRSAHRSSDRSLASSWPSRQAGRCMVIPPTLLSADGQPGESNHRSSRRPTRCIAMRCRPHRERALPPPTGSSGMSRCWHRRLSCLLHGGPSPLAAKLVAGGYGGPGMNENPAGTPGCRRGARMGSRMAGMPAGCIETPCVPGPGTDAGQDHPAGPGSVTSRWSIPVRYRSPGRRRVRLPGASASQFRRRAE
jgi:hypothetical protein